MAILGKMKIFGNNSNQDALSNSNQLTGSGVGPATITVTTNGLNSTNVCYGNPCTCGAHGAGLLAQGFPYYMPGNLATTMTGLPAALTPEERTELERLESDRITAERALKIKIFKSTPAAIRQRVVDNIIWKQTVAAANVLVIEKSDRQKDLEFRDNPIKTYLGGGYGSQLGTPYNKFKWPGLATPEGWEYSSTIEGLSDDDLIAAHTEACAEEALVGTDTK